MILAQGRAFEISAGTPGTRFSGATCYTFQPGRAEEARRKSGADIDFSDYAAGPMADRADIFTRKES